MTMHINPYLLAAIIWLIGFLIVFFMNKSMLKFEKPSWDNIAHRWAYSTLSWITIIVVIIALILLVCLSIREIEKHENNPPSFL